MMSPQYVKCEISSVFHPIYSPIAYTDPLNCNMAGLFTELFKDALNEYAYDAELAGLSYDLMNTICGMVVSESESVKYMNVSLERLSSFKLQIISIEHVEMFMYKLWIKTSKTVYTHTWRCM